MRVKCLHGYFQFFESYAGEAADFMRASKLSLVAVEDFFTFEQLAEAPEFSLQGRPILGLTLATKTFAGKPWEVFRENGIVFNFVTGLVVPIETVISKTRIELAGSYFIVPRGGLLLPGSLTDGGRRVKDYSAWLSQTRQTWRYSEVSFD